MTLNTLNKSQTQHLTNTKLNYYNHNLNTSPKFYDNIITTHTYQKHLDTLKKIHDTKIKIYSNDIINLNETIKNRTKLLLQLTNLPTPPKNIPINILIKIKNTPLTDNDNIDTFNFIHTITITQIIIPTSYIHLSTKHEQINKQTQTIYFITNTNSIFYNYKLLTTPNPKKNKNLQLFHKLKLNPQQTTILTNDNKQQQHLKQTLITPNTDKYYNTTTL